MARRHAEGCAKRADDERELARRARVKAESSQDPRLRANLEQLAHVHDHAAALQTQAATYYRQLADLTTVPGGP
jgi:hypothetical protein